MEGWKRECVYRVMDEEGYMWAEMWTKGTGVSVEKWRGKNSVGLVGLVTDICG